VKSSGKSFVFLFFFFFLPFHFVFVLKPKVLVLLFYMSNHVDVNPFSWGGFESLVYLGYFRYDDYLLAFKSFNGLSAPLPFDGNGKFLFFVGLPFNNAFFFVVGSFLRIRHRHGKSLLGCFGYFSAFTRWCRLFRFRIPRVIFSI
jgi:hypothetical protein